ncbi:MAG: sigma-70 family RNA polymerase sigma factor [Fibrobacter sp.]|nr:sigma-70 family RNA polymerase sigma factor [Fibrobacter sp.]
MQEHEFKQIYSKFGRSLYNFILWLTRDRSPCDDILQTVFINIWKCQSVPSDEIELQRWLFTITRNACLDHFRKTTRFSRFRTQYTNDYYEPPTDPDAGFTWNELSALPETEKSILYLHIKIGYTYKEIGDMLEMTENLVRVRAFRALKKLRENLTKKEL